MTDTSTEAVERLVVRLMQARDHVQRFIDHYFRNDAQKPQISIPASPKYDSDLIVHQAIKDAQETIRALAAERDALKAEVKRLRGAFLEQSMPCTCREAYSGRGLQDPECPAGEYGDDCRVAIGLSPLCQFNEKPAHRKGD
jgi:hypothetical protein